MNRKTMTLVLGLAAVTSIAAMGHITPTTVLNSHSESMGVTKKKVANKKPAIKLYPNPSLDGNITVSSNTEGKLHFYVFDVEGTLLHQVVLKEKQRHSISKLKKGVYVYDAFLNDESIEHGQLVVK